MSIITPFSSDIFTEVKPNFINTEKKIHHDLENIFENFYIGLDAKIRKIKKSKGIEINSNNFLIETNKDSYLLKLFSGINECDKKYLEKQYSFVAWIYDNKLPCPRPIKNKYQKYICDIGNKRFACLMTYIDGSFFPGIDAYNIREIGETVGKFHCILNSAPKELMPKKKYTHLSQLDLENFNEVVSMSGEKLFFFTDSQRNMLLSNRDFLVEIWERVLGGQEEFINSEQGLVHIDIHPHNIIMRNGKISAFLDFDSLMRGPFKMMFSFSAYKLLRQVVFRDIKRNFLKGMYKYVDEYLDGVYRYYPDLKAEKKHMAIFAYTEICRRIAIILKLNIQEGNSKWNYVLPIHISGLFEVKELFEQ